MLFCFILSKSLDNIVCPIITQLYNIIKNTFKKITYKHENIDVQTNTCDIFKKITLIQSCIY